MIKRSEMMLHQKWVYFIYFACLKKMDEVWIFFFIYFYIKVWEDSLNHDNVMLCISVSEKIYWCMTILCIICPDLWGFIEVCSNSILYFQVWEDSLKCHYIMLYISKFERIHWSATIFYFIFSGLRGFIEACKGQSVAGIGKKGKDGKFKVKDATTCQQFCDSFR